MWVLIAGLATSVVGTLLTILIRHRIRRNRTLSTLAAQRQQHGQDRPAHFAALADRRALAERFHYERLVRIDNFLMLDDLRRLRAEAEQAIPQMVPSYIPLHKQGQTLSYEDIHRFAQNCLELYHSSELKAWISSITSEQVQPTPDRDQSSLSLLCYKNPGDHINWHYDHNFYRGRHFTVLLSLANESSSGGVSQSQLMRRTSDRDEVIETSANSLVVFEGARVLHRASPTREGDLRIMLSMTFCTDPRIRLWKEMARRVKDTAFFGIRALWD
ncbi:HalD/BesD family halogenase [Schlesneria paludicola]|uniref:HalD/BesD family halogenase n=1 Tax=Schlesneria paludicola TaxID=360056 RepID=UPI00029A74CF|nr:2OG-Fe(II) oxygenase [Schlesneria paludicola]